MSPHICQKTDNEKNFDISYLLPSTRDNQSYPSIDTKCIHLLVEIQTFVCHIVPLDPTPVDCWDLFGLAKITKHIPVQRQL